MKKILISIKPKYVKEILNGNKTLEIRKSFPKCELPCEVYIYCTKEKNKFDTLIPDGENYLYGCPYENFHYLKVNGKVVAKFTLNKVEEIERNQFSIHWTKTLKGTDLCEMSCLTPTQLSDYLRSKKGYAWHIDNLVIFDKPKELGDFIDTDTPTYEQAKPFLEMFGKPYYKETYKESCERLGYTLRRPPQSWRYVKEI